ncbi:MAG: energy transducer TonB [Cyanobacteria bacterium J06600_6]
MVDLKPAKPKKKKTTIVRRGINSKQLLLLVLVSILIHALGLFLFARYQPPTPSTSSKDSLEPIDFTVIPEESVETVDEDKINETDQIKNDLATEPPPIPEPPAPPPVTEPAPTPAPAPKAVSPPRSEPEPLVEEPEPEPIVSGSDNPVPAPEPNPVATKLPTKSPPAPEPEVPPEKPTNPDGVSTSASDLFGGDYEKTLASGGDAFFSPEALEYNSVLNPEQLKALKGIDLSKYLSAMESKVKPNWKPAFRQEDRTTVLRFNIEKNGQVTGLNVVQSSGIAEVDRESLEAIEKSAPFAPLPANFPLDSLEITFSFNIHVY